MTKEEIKQIENFVFLKMEEYEKALKEMNGAFYGITFLKSQTRRFDDNLNLLRELVNEHFEERQETNLEHYYNDLLKLNGSFSLINGKIGICQGICCSRCAFNKDYCQVGRMEWLKQPYKKSKYKLTQFEYDLIKTYSYVHEGYTLSKFKRLIKLKDKGYFKCADYDTKIQDILANCEVVE